ncbi:MAG: TonB-dependent receptor plug domain-containing protein, partial [Segetibacter sp.]
MNLIACRKLLYPKRIIVVKMRRAVRFTAILMLAICLQAEAKGPSQKLTISYKKVAIEKVFKEITKQAGLTFMYSGRLLQKGKIISISANNASIEQVLKECLDNEDIIYSIVDNHIIIRDKEDAGKEEAFSALPPEAVATGILSGKVLNDKGEPLSGATIKEKGTKNTTVTREDGSFTINTSSAKPVLVVSYVGFETKELSVSNQTNINIPLVPTSNSLNDVVVIGYGARKKSDLTGSVATISSENLKDRAVVNFGEAMAGQLAGVQVQQISGAPGGEGLTVRVRGTGSITQSNSPLYVVDGYPMEDGAFRLINPNDVESLQVLKDASSTAIYGSRGANGVVIITTKKGKAGSTSISVNAFTGYQNRTKTIAVMNRDQYVQWFTDGRNQAWLDQPNISADPNTAPHT